MKKSEAARIWAEEQIAFLQPLLNIQHWRVAVQYDKKLSGCWAVTTMAAERRVAEITLSKEFVEDSRQERERVLIHELLHLQHEDAMAVLRLEVSPRTMRAFWVLEEKAVDDMACVLHGLIYK